MTTELLMTEIPEELMDRICKYADEHGLSEEDAVNQLLNKALAL